MDLFGGSPSIPAIPAPPPIPPPVPMPDLQSPQALEAARTAQSDIQRRGGRRSTILSQGTGDLAPYTRPNLGNQ